jgi:hypothetical protein
MFFLKMTDKQINHPEWKEENSLTVPADRDPARTYRLKGGAPPLTDEETAAAMKEMVVDDYVRKFPQRERFYADPAIPMQEYGLFSFVPAKGATPDKNGMYGMAKYRGSFHTNEECREREEYILREVDSYHKIYVTYIGRPYPITTSSQYSAETNEVDVRKKVTEVMSQDVKKQKRDEQKQMEEIKDRAEELYEDTAKEDLDDIDPMELYTTLKVKKAQLSWTYLEHMKKIREIEGIITKTREEIAELDEKDSAYSEQFYDKYMTARRKAGLPETDESFIQYLVEDAELPF